MALRRPARARLPARRRRQADERVAEAIEVVGGKQDPDGRWPLENVYEGAAYFQMEDGEGQPSRWNTLHALRVLDWFDRGGAT